MAVQPPDSLLTPGSAGILPCAALWSGSVHACETDGCRPTDSTGGLLGRLMHAAVNV